MNKRSFTERLAETVCSYKYDKLPDEVISMACKLFADMVGSAVAGSVLPEADIIRKFALEDNNSPKSTILGTWEKTSDINAAMVNSYNSHILEMDDFHSVSSQHPGITVIPTALALAERYQLSGKKMLEAIVAGYEAVIRVGEALGKSHYYFWHTTCTAGGFGSAAAAGISLNLNEEQMVHAFGSAGSQAAGLWQFLEENAMTKYLHCAKANANGMIAANLAKNGLTGARYILEGKRGLLLATSQPDHPERAFESLGSEYKIMTAGIKPWASCRHTHSVIEACLNLKAKYNFDYSKIDRIVIETYKAAANVAKNNVSFDDVRSAKFSITYCAALALIFGKVETYQFPLHIKEERILNLVSKMEIKTEPEFDNQWPENWNARVTVHTEGKQYQERVSLAKGEIKNPMTMQEVEDKFCDMTSKILGKENARILVKRCFNVDQMDNVAALFKGLTHLC
jgi:2-methylcitrate dehydratase PrpD